MEKKEEAFRTAKRRTGKRYSIWTDGSRLDDERAGTAVVWPSPPRPRQVQTRGPPTTPCAEQPTGQGASSYHLGHNKEVFDAELHALRRAFQIFNKRGGRDRRYTIFDDSASAIDRVASGSLGPGQRLAVEA